MKRLGLTTLLVMTLPALALWGQAVFPENLPTVAEVQPLKAAAFSTLAAVFSDAGSTESDRLSTVFVLSRSKDLKAVPLLIDVLTGDSFASVRREAARSLGDFQTAEAIPALYEAAQNEFLASTRWSAAVSILRLRPIEVEFLKSLLGETNIVAEAGLYLKEPGYAAEFPVSLRSYIEDAFMTAVQDPDNYNAVERSAMLKSFINLRSLRAVPLLLTLLNDNDTDGFVRGSAAYVLGQLQVVEAVDDLLLQLDGGDKAVQIGALDALGRLSDLRALQPIARILESEGSAEIRASAATALSGFGVNAVSPLSAALQSDASVGVRQAAMAGLAAIGGESATTAVLQFLDSGYFSQCDPIACSGLALETMLALAALDQGERAVEILRSALDQLRDGLPILFALVEQQLVRVATQVGLAAPQVFDLLLSDESPFVLNLGITALVNVEGRAAREQILAYISPDAHVLVRRAALEGLSQMAVPDDVDIFSTWLTDRDRRSRLAGFKALSRFGDERALEPIQMAMSDGRLSTRLQAAEAAYDFAGRIEGIFQSIQQITPDSRQRNP